jgi:hypothetical protein
LPALPKLSRLYRMQYECSRPGCCCRKVKLNDSSAEILRRVANAALTLIVADLEILFNAEALRRRCVTCCAKECTVAGLSWFVRHG